MNQHLGPDEFDAPTAPTGADDLTAALPTTASPPTTPSSPTTPIARGPLVTEGSPPAPALPRSWLEAPAGENGSATSDSGRGSSALTHPEGQTETVAAQRLYKRGPAVFTMFSGALLLGVAVLTIIAQVRREPIAFATGAPYVLVGIGLFITAVGALAALGRRQPPAR